MTDPRGLGAQSPHPQAIPIQIMVVAHVGQENGWVDVSRGSHGSWVTKIGCEQPRAGDGRAI